MGKCSAFAGRGRQAAAAEKVETALEMDASNVDAAQLRQALRQRGSVKK